MMFQDWAKVAKIRALMPYWISTALPKTGTKAIRSVAAATRRDDPSAASCRPQGAGRAKHQDHHQQAEADDIGVGGAEIERGQGFGHADDETGQDHGERIVQPADDRDDEGLGR